MNNPGIWYGIIAFIIWITVIVVCTIKDNIKGLADFWDYAAGPGLIVAILWPMGLLLAFMFAVLAIAVSPAYIVYLITKYIVSKGRR